jgi:hypothetical protein
VLDGRLAVDDGTAVTIAQCRPEPRPSVAHGRPIIEHHYCCAPVASCCCSTRVCCCGLERSSRPSFSERGAGAPGAYGVHVPTRVLIRLDRQSASAALQPRGRLHGISLLVAASAVTWPGEGVRSHRS